MQKKNELNHNNNYQANIMFYGNGQRGKRKFRENQQQSIIK